MEKSIVIRSIVQVRSFKHKICLNLFIVLIISTQALSAQDSKFHYGAKFGIGESSIESKELPGVRGKLMLSGGITAEHALTDFLGMGMDFLLTSKGAKRDGSVTSYDLLGNPSQQTFQETYHLLYAEIPLMLNLSADLGGFYPRVFGGPSINFKLSATESRVYDDQEYEGRNGYSLRGIKDAETVEYALNYGLAADFPDRNARIYFVELKFSKALSPFVKNGSNEINSEYYGMYAGYKF